MQRRPRRGELWISRRCIFLVRHEFVQDGVPLSEMLKGRRVNVGEPGTNDYLVANEVIRYLRLKPTDATGSGDYVETRRSKDDLSTTR